jgi:hypothetical protein
MAAGELNVAKDPRDYIKLGVGLAYIIYTKPTGGAPVPAPGPIVVTPVPLEGQIPMNVLDGNAVKSFLTTPQTKVRLVKGTAIYDRPGGKIITKASKDLTVVLSGYPATGWRTVVISTSAGSSNGQQQTVEAYVPKGAALPV